MTGGGDDEATAFDLTALLDILSNIIFFLMASFGAAILSVLPAKVPTTSENGESDVANEGDKVTVTMTLNKRGAVEISAANQELFPDELAKFSKSIPGKDGQLDVEAVNSHLWSIKEQFRASKDLVLIPEPDVRYAMMIEAMDVARERRMEVNGQLVYPKLFPAVIVSSKAR